jgi:pyridoxine 5-phosphate synthase
MKLGVNIDHIATLRNARGGAEPDVLAAALICEEIGVNAITVHLREDRRHIRDLDLQELKKALKINLNLEMATTEEMQAIALEICPNVVCLVPEKRQELTTEGGLDVAGQIEKIKNFIEPLKAKGIAVSLFIDPEWQQIEAAAEIGAEFVELHTGCYAQAFSEGAPSFEFERLKTAAALAQKLGLKVNAGHGLNYENVLALHDIEGLYELNIGHSIVSRAVFDGFKRAVFVMMGLLNATNAADLRKREDRRGRRVEDFKSR